MKWMLTFTPQVVSQNNQDLLFLMSPAATLYLNLGDVTCLLLYYYSITVYV